MTFKVFLTGGSGYVGGSVLDTIVKAHPEYEMSVLLRKVPDAFSSTYPDIKIIKGDYDAFDTIADGAEAANLVVHTGDSDHEASLNALITGLLRRSTPGYLIHLSGSSIIADGDNDKYYGKLNPNVWSDIASLSEIQSLSPDALHRNTETIINNAQRDHGDKINIAIMSPPDIYGKGKGLAKTHSVFVPTLVEGIKNLGWKVFYYGEGANTRSWVHMDDLMKLYLEVVQAAEHGETGDYFNEGGYYFASTQEHSHLDIARVTGKVLQQQGKVSDPEPQQVGLDKLDESIRIPGYDKIRVGRWLFASNSRSKADRAAKLFAYKGTSLSLLECLEAEIVATI